jgi:hypothetical protein
LPNVEPDVFEAYFTWVYGDRIDLNPVSNLHAYEDLAQAKYYQLVRLWVFADSILDHELCNRLANDILQFAKEIGGRVQEPTVEWVWKNTSIRSPLRKLLLDIWFDSLKSSSSYETPFHIKGRTDDIPRLVLLDFASLHVKWNILSMHGYHSRYDREDRRCRYHLHAGGGSCKR